MAQGRSDDARMSVWQLNVSSDAAVRCRSLGSAAVVGDQRALSDGTSARIAASSEMHQLSDDPRPASMLSKRCGLSDDPFRKRLSVGQVFCSFRRLHKIRSSPAPRWKDVRARRALNVRPRVLLPQRQVKGIRHCDSRCRSFCSVCGVTSVAAGQQPPKLRLVMAPENWMRPNGW